MDKLLEEQFRALKKEFVGSLVERLDYFESTVIGFEGKSLSDLSLSDLVRDIHSLKGAGGSYNLQIMSDLAHLFEDCLEDLIKSAGPIRNIAVNKFLSVLDLMRQVVSVVNSGAAGEDEQREFSKILQEAQKLNQHNKKIKIFVVDRSKLLPRLVEKTLKELSSEFEITIDHNTDSYLALGKVLRSRPDILISGAQFNGLSGEGLISAVKLSAGCDKVYSILTRSKESSVRSEVKSKAEPDLILEKNEYFAKRLTEVVVNIIESK
jgi:chemotaxis protein histidine kinase CheA